MDRPTKITIDKAALLHNVARVKSYAPGKSIMAMLKANAYGCGIARVVPVLSGQVELFGVACLDEALAIQKVDPKTPCMLLEGVFSKEELLLASQKQFPCVIHNAQQLQWLLSIPLPNRLAVWLKVNTGMQRLGFFPEEIPHCVKALQTCAWVKKELGLMTHLACADRPEQVANAQQIERFQAIDHQAFYQLSLANSAALIAFPKAQADVVRPGIMLYGVSPFPDKTAWDLQLQPVMRLSSAVVSIQKYPAFSPVGYGGAWSSDKPSLIGIVPVGYGDGYPRHIAANTPVWIKGQEVPIVGRISMDMLTVDLTNHPDTIELGTPVELWGEKILLERIAQSAGTIGYELLCQVTNRAHGIF